ncbi:uncharacterized protein UV8b_07770 [Ustilaginoidea virens]|uniref:Uncharacterized protein n=1 Tax=Ustilaginoidea virens TaxID=1159556 RepID=A0A063BWS8_USTVR|nr:uncharacterized protein UV8b_07770 [Ustilaginoidea virens]QUC23529.1 hypothetical protein UV8b_07770 [Ustilaginoidea virens]GAO15883.1 hypothetical protein UVI_02051370 [Ustilaginoidea virens]
MASSPPPDYELIYWPGIPGRGEFIRLLFEDAGVPYLDTAKSADDDDAATRALLQLVAPSNTGDATNGPVFACPALKHGRLTLAQTPNILLYLAPRLGLAPPDDGLAIYHLNQIALTLLDAFANEVHDTHHPVSVSAHYRDQKPEAERRARSYTRERLPKFLAYVQRLLDGDASGQGPWLHGGRCTYVDLVLFQGLDGTMFAFPKTVAKLRESGKYDGVFQLYEAVKQRPNIKAYLASERRVPYADGIWRHYPELDE